MIAKAPDPSSDSYPPVSLVTAAAAFEIGVGGRAALLESLSHAVLDPQQERVAGVIADPRNDGLSLAQICQAHGIQLSALRALYFQAGKAKAEVAAMQRVWGLTPDLAEDVMLRALPHDLPCTACGGKGAFQKTVLNDDGAGKVVKVVTSEACAICQGEGKVLKQPDRAQQELALKLTGLIAPAGPGAAVNVNVSQRTAVQVGAGEGGVFSSFLAASDKVLYPDRGGLPAARPAITVVATPVVSEPEDPEPPANLDDADFDQEAERLLGDEG